MTMQGRTQSEDPEHHHRIWLDSVTPTTLQPRSSTLRFPPIWSPEGCSPRCEVLVVCAVFNMATFGDAFIT